MPSYDHFINVNKIPNEVTKIGVYDSNGNRVGEVPVLSKDKINTTTLGNKLYSFGAISDIHLQYDTAQEDFQKALTYFNNNENVAFTCIAGDLTQSGTAEHLTTFKNMVDTYSPDTPVYAITGNHEGYNSSISTIIEQYTGHPMYYSFTQGNDVFIMVGTYTSTNGKLFTTQELQWLYETLEANRNKRCFVFEHVRPQDGCGNTFGIYNYDIWGGTEQTVFESLLRHYHNVILFHGHSHLKFYLQYGSDVANYDNIFGCHSIHIPSLAVPRDGDATGANSRKEIYAESEGYVVDVYENHIVLKGRDFVDEKFVPIAIYQLDTTLQTIEEGTYTDSTGIINTGSTSEPSVPDPTPSDVVWTLNKTLGSNGSEGESPSDATTSFIPVNSSTTYILHNGASATTRLYYYNTNKTFISRTDRIGANATYDFTSDISTNNVAYVRIRTNYEEPGYDKTTLAQNVYITQS